MIAGAALVAVVAAGLVGAPPLPLSADDAVTRALASHPELSLMQERVAEAEAERESALILENPELRARHFRPGKLAGPLWGAPQDEYPLDGSRVDLRWKPPPLESFGPRQSEGDRRVQASVAELEEARLLLAEEVRASHARLLSLRRRLTLADESVALSARASELTERLREARATTGLKVSLARLDALDAIADRERVRSQYEDELVRLRGFTGLAPDDEVDLVAPSEPLCRVRAESAEDLVERAVSSSPRLAALEQEVLAEESRGTGVALSRVPWFDFVQVSLLPGDRNDDPSVGFATSIVLPVLDWKISEAREAEAKRARLVAEREAERRLLTTRVRRAAEDLRQKAALVALYGSAQQEVLDEGLSQVQRALEAGEVNAAEVALVQARTVRAQRDALEAALGCEEAALRLDRLLGAPATARLVSPH